MSFQSPWFFLLLIPAAAVALWLMRRQGEQIAVPFIHLWPSNPVPAGRRPRPRRLPLWVVLLLISSVCAIVAAAGPYWGAGWKRPIHLIVDRGLTMSAGTAAGPARFDAAVKQLLADETLQLEIVSLDIVPPLPNTPTPPAAALQQVIPRTPLETQQALRAQLARGNSSVPRMVVSEHRVELWAVEQWEKGSIVPLRPPAPAPNCGIELLAAVNVPSPQVMVTLRSDVEQEVALTVTSGGAAEQRRVGLQADQPQNVFIDLPALADVVEARVEAPADSLPADNRAWVVRNATWPTLAAGPGVPAELARFAEVYASLRVPDPSSVPVRLLASSDDDDSPAVILGATRGGAGDLSGAPELLSELGREVDWARAGIAAAVGPEPDASWRPLVRVGGRTLLAERTGPPRQVLVNFWSDAFAAQPDFVVLLGSIADSFAADGTTWTAEPIVQPPSSWRLLTTPVAGFEPSPGVYRDEANQLRALNTPSMHALQPAAADTSHERRQLANVPLVPASGADLSGWCTLAALGLLLLALVARVTKRHSAA